MYKFFLILILSLALFFQAQAQLHIGFTADYGNSVDYFPESKPFLKAPNSFSGSIFFYIEESINDEWGLKYGASAGALGYNIYAQAFFDTLTTIVDEDFYTFYPHYNTIYTSTHLAIGRKIKLPNRLPDVNLFLGGGLTYYFASSVSRTTEGCEVSPCQVIFEHSMESESNSVKGFLEISVATHVAYRLSIGLQYRRHFSPAVRGSYNFYHVNNPPSGSIELTQKAISIVLAYDIKRLKIP